MYVLGSLFPLFRRDNLLAGEDEVSLVDRSCKVSAGFIVWGSGLPRGLRTGVLYSVAAFEVSHTRFVSGLGVQYPLPPPGHRNSLRVSRVHPRSRAVVPRWSCRFSFFFFFFFLLHFFFQRIFWCGVRRYGNGGWMAIGDVTLSSLDDVSREKPRLLCGLPIRPSTCKGIST